MERSINPSRSDAYRTGWQPSLAEFIRKSRNERAKCRHVWKPCQTITAGWRRYCENCGAKAR